MSIYAPTTHTDTVTWMQASLARSVNLASHVCMQCFSCKLKHYRCHHATTPQISSHQNTTDIITSRQNNVQSKFLTPDMLSPACLGLSETQHDVHTECSRLMAGWILVLGSKSSSAGIAWHQLQAQVALGEDAPHLPSQCLCRHHWAVCFTAQFGLQQL